jgi:hypothetical protein
MNLNKTMKHFGLAGTGVIVLLLMVVVYYLHLIEENTSLEAFSVGAQFEPRQRQHYRAFSAQQHLPKKR